MLRALLAALVVANLLFFAFTRGSLDGFLGLRALGDREPERLANQVRPQTIRLLPMSAAASAPVDSEAPCFETPTFTAAEAAAVEATLASNLPPGSWSDNRGERSVGTRTEVTHSYRVVSADAALAARAGGAEARRRRARLQRLREGRSAALSAARAARSRRAVSASASTAVEQQQQPADAERAAAARRAVGAGGVEAGGVVPEAATTTDSVAVETLPLLSVVVSWIRNVPAALAVTVTAEPLLAPTIAAPLVPAFRIVQA